MSGGANDQIFARLEGTFQQQILRNFRQVLFQKVIYVTSLHLQTHPIKNEWLNSFHFLTFG